MKTNSITTKQLTDWILITLRESAWAPLSVYGFYVFGLLIDLFDRYPYLDMPVHFMGGVVITYFYRSAIHNSQKFLGEIPSLIQVLFAFTCTGTTTVLWEFYENFADRYLNTQMVRGLEDTIVDLLVGVAGALLLSVFYRRRSLLTIR